MRKDARAAERPWGLPPYGLHGGGMSTAGLASYAKPETA